MLDIVLGAALAAVSAVPSFGSERHRFDVSAEDARAAIQSFAAQAQVQILVAGEQIRDKRLNSVSGNFSTDEALQKLLIGTGLTPQYVSARAIALVAAPAAGFEPPSEALRVDQNDTLGGASPAEGREKLKNSNFISRFIAFLGSALGASTFAVHAQNTSTAGAAESGELEEIVVTGTRLQVSGFTTPTPVTVIGADFIEQRAPVDMGELIREIPQMRNVNGSFNTGAGQASSAGQANVDLRLGFSRTLVLVNGHRVSATGTAGGFDINILPSALIERVEVVTGGASAAYGSDAIAGVTNFILKDKLDGFSGTVTGAAAEHGGNNIGSVSLAFGTDIGNRTHLLFGIDVSDNSGLGSWYERDFGRQEPGLVSNGTASAVTGAAPAGRIGHPAQEWVNQYELANRTSGGTITACTPSCPASLTNVAFAADGTPYTMQKGALDSSGANMYGVTSNYGDSTRSYFNLSTPYSRKSGLARVAFDLTDDTKLQFEVMAARNTASNLQDISRTSTVIAASNPFIPAATRAAMASANVSSITVGRTNTDLGALEAGQTDNFVNLLADISGKIFTDWSWNAYYQRSDTKLDGTATGLRTADVAAAFSACTTLTGASPGCVPFNIFGVGNASAAAYAYLNQYTQGFLTTITQDVVEASLNGEPLSTWAGPIAFATGATYRKNTLDNALARDSVKFPNGGFATGNYVSYYAERSVKEGFVEVNVPLLRDAPAAKAFDFNGAFRKASYSDSGSYTTWKTGLTWDINDQYRLRATRSRDMRAPTLFEQYGIGGQSTQQISNPFTGTTDTYTFRKGVSPTVRGELADTFTVGLVFQPQWISGLRMSVDYWDIKLTGAIAAPSTTELLNGCRLQNIANYCSQLTFDATGRLTAVVTETLNLNQLNTNGLDIEMAYRMPAKVFGGSLTFTLLATHVYSNTTVDPSNAVTESAGSWQTPRWEGKVGVTYAKGPFATTAEVTAFDRLIYSTSVIGPDNPQYYATVTDRNCPGGTASAPTQCPWYMVGSNSISKNLFPGAAYLNWSARYDLSVSKLQKLQVFVGINNVLDKEPPEFAASAFAVTSAYDFIGRAYRAGVRFAF